MSLEQLLEDGVVDEVLSRLKSGKEADVWLVRHHGEVLCAKVYKDRGFRSFKNNAGYKEGRAVRNTRTQRAMDRGSRFGQAAAEEAWKSAESDALHRLHAEGVRVPAPVLFYEGILLMKLVVDAEGHPAPRLIDAPVQPAQATALYADLRGQAVRMLCAELIHGDLSPYNVLLGAEGPTIIDFPQVVSAAHNSTAQSYFTRDVENVRKFFAGIDPALEARAGDAAEIWRAYVRRELTPDFVPSGRVPEQRPPQEQRHRGSHRPAQQHGRPHGHRPQAQHPRPPASKPPPQQRQPAPAPRPAPAQRPTAHPQRPASHPQRPASHPQRPASHPQRPASHPPRPGPPPQRAAPHPPRPAPHPQRAAPHPPRPAPHPRPPRHPPRAVPQEKLPPQIGRSQPPRVGPQPDQVRPPADPGKHRR